MRLAGFLAALAVVASIPACPPAPVNPFPPSPDDGGIFDSGRRGATCASACANLAVIPCSEGTAPNCEATCRHVQVAHLTDLHLDCLAKARTKVDARRCKSVDCP